MLLDTRNNFQDQMKIAILTASQGDGVSSSQVVQTLEDCFPSIAGNKNDNYRIR